MLWAESGPFESSSEAHALFAGLSDCPAVYLPVSCSANLLGVLSARLGLCQLHALGELEVASFILKWKAKAMKGWHCKPPSPQKSAKPFQPAIRYRPKHAAFTCNVPGGPSLRECKRCTPQTSTMEHHPSHPARQWHSGLSANPNRKAPCEGKAPGCWLRCWSPYTP